MTKPLFILFFGLWICETAYSQSSKTVKQDTVFFYAKNSGQLTRSRDSAEYAVFIMPRNLQDKNSLYPVFEYYLNGKGKFIGASHSQTYPLQLDGLCTEFYTNGNRKRLWFYKNGLPTGEVIDYYPTSKIHTIKKYTDEQNLLKKKLLLMEYRDSTGKALAENGQGQWIKYNEDFNNIYQEGPIKDGLEDGTWFIHIDDKKQDFVYTAGEITTPINYDFSGEVIEKGYVFKKTDVLPVFKDGFEALYTFLAHKIHYPAVDREKKIQGHVVLNFIVEKDGMFNDIKVVESPSVTLSDEVIRAVKLSQPWVPGLVDGKNVRYRYTIPVNMVLSKD